MVDHDRIAALQDILATNPNDAFARYALGLEYSGSGNSEGALAEFQSLLTTHPDYTNGYFMAAQVLERLGRLDEARAMLTRGIETAQQSNNRHAQSEMQDMLDQLQFRE
jgi:tetratricopeptide (TPR) repeat protein